MLRAWARVRVRVRAQATPNPNQVSESGKKKDGATISAELVLDGGVAATATF